MDSRQMMLEQVWERQPISHGEKSRIKRNISRLVLKIALNATLGEELKLQRV